ncbi:MAG: hypothetical protein ACWGQW_07195 [bacterium]
MKKALIFAAAGFFVLLISASLIGVYFAPRIKVEIAELLSERTGLQVRIDSFGGSFWPALQFKGRGLSIGSSEERDALFIYVEEIRLQAGLWGLLVQPRSLESLTLVKTLIRVPPRKSSKTAHLQPAAIEPENPGLTAASALTLEQLVMETAVVELLPKDAEKDSRIIQIRRFVMNTISLVQASPFEADLRYPRPEGDVFVRGRFGPFDRDEPINTPISGDYVFKEADLGTFREISGILTSSGNFKGSLGENQVTGTAQIPDFQLTKVENIVPLDVSFEVDRISGDVFLKEVDTSFLESRLIATGEIIGSPKGKGRIVDLEVQGGDARVEDLLRLALKGDTPPLTGEITLDTKVTIAPGPGRVMQKLIIDGDFTIEEGEFTNEGFQKKLGQIGKIGRRDQNELEDSRTFSDLAGEFHLEKGVIEFTTLQFGVPGMLVSLKGTYALEAEQMDFRGRVEMERSVSEMTSGRLSDWLRVLDPLLKRGNAGTSVPIRIKGSKDRPSVSVDF